MTHHRILAPADYRKMPWKNGGGQTFEIAVDPPGADLATFAWRVSVAAIERDGPFSSFPGVDRTLVLLDGSGMRLSGEGQAVELRAPYEPVTFSGEATLDCSLAEGPTRDFNLMIRRALASGEVRGRARRERGDRAGGGVCLLRRHRALPSASSRATRRSRWRPSTR